MRGISFLLSGKTAMFKKPDVNANVYLTFNNIHKVALLGLLGAVIGLDGHEQHVRDKKCSYPAFYEQLKDLEIAIQPLGNGEGGEFRGHFVKKLQTFNNSVGYASQEEGGNLVVKEYWLENPKWRIYIKDDGSQNYQKVAQSLLNKKVVYTPYLGKNDHIADITDIKEVELTLHKVKEAVPVHSLISLDRVTFTAKAVGKGSVFLFKESLPVALMPDANIYQYDLFVYTNQGVEELEKEAKLYSCEDQYLYFF